MKHTMEYGQTLSVDQANILDRYLQWYSRRPSYNRIFQEMAMELTKLGYEEGRMELESLLPELCNRCFDTYWSMSHDE